MMFLLCQNIITNLSNISFGDGKSRTSLLPLKHTGAQFIPINKSFRTVGNNCSQFFFIQISRTRNKNMYVFRIGVNGIQMTLIVIYNACDILFYSFTMLFRDERQAIYHCKDEMCI